MHGNHQINPQTSSLEYGSTHREACLEVQLGYSKGHRPQGPGTRERWGERASDCGHPALAPWVPPRGAPLVPPRGAPMVPEAMRAGA